MMEDAQRRREEGIGPDAGIKMSGPKIKLIGAPKSDYTIEEWEQECKKAADARNKMAEEEADIIDAEIVSTQVSEDIE
jgi:hypothetical protein